MLFAIVGYMNILSELCSSKKWVRRYCHVKLGILECFKDSPDETEDLEWQLPLSGVEIQAASEGKRSLALKLMLDSKEKVVLDVRNIPFDNRVDCKEKVVLDVRDIPFGNRVDSKEKVVFDVRDIPFDNRVDSKENVVLDVRDIPFDNRVDSKENAVIDVRDIPFDNRGRLQRKEKI